MGMDKDADLRFESSRLVGGGSSYALVHIPTGLRVEDPGPSEKPVAERWTTLRGKLAELLRSSAEQSPP
jgi:hypothetical protein